MNEEQKKIFKTHFIKQYQILNDTYKNLECEIKLSFEEEKIEKIEKIKELKQELIKIYSSIISEL